MKTILWLTAAFVLCAIPIPSEAQRATSTAEAFQGAGYQIGEKALHRRVWSRVILHTNLTDGTISRQTNRITELSSGLHRWLTNQAGASLVECTPEIVTTTNGFLARGAGHQALFAPNANSYAAVQTRLADGQVLKSHFLGLAYHDVASGSNIMFAVVKDCAARLIGSNSVIYPDAFTDLNASIRYTYTKAGISQDIVIHERPPDPADWGLNPATTHLLAITEFVESPAPQIQERTWLAGLETLQDQRIEFGPMLMIPGHALTTPYAGKSDVIPVAKTFQTLGNRTVLVERLQFSRARAQLMSLAPAGTTLTNSVTTNGSVSKLTRWLAQGSLPPAPKVASISPTPVRTAALVREDGFTMDYDLVYNGEGVYFWCGTTFLIDGPIYINYADFEAGSVLKYTHGSSLGISSWGQWNSYGSEGDPNCGYYSLLTSANDDSLGEIIPGSTTDPQWGDYGPALTVDCTDLNVLQQHLNAYYGPYPMWVADPPCIPTVSIAASDPTATKSASDNGTFNISRVNGDWSQAVFVLFAIGGSGVSGTDYEPISGGGVWIPAYQGSVDVTVQPKAASGLVWEGSVTLTIQSSSSYIMGAPSAATVWIYDPTFTPPAPIAAPANLAGWWRAEGNAFDAVSGNNGTLLNGAGFAPSIVSQAFSFDGIDDRVTVPDSASLNFGAGADFSIEAWIRPVGASYDYSTRPIVNKISSSPAIGYSLYLNGGNLAFQLGASGSFATFGPAGGELRDGRFHHIAVTVVRNSSTGGHLYVDGSSVLTFNPTGQQGTLLNTQLLRIGNSGNNNWNPYFKGIIDEPSLYNRALPSTEIQNIYNAVRGGKTLGSVEPPSFSPVGGSYLALLR